MCAFPSRCAASFAVLVAMLAAVTLALAGAGVASAHVFHTAAGRFVGIAPRHGVRPASIHGATDAARASTSAAAAAGAGNGNLDYHGGSVLHSSAPYLVFWDPDGHIPTASRAVLQRYLADSAADSGKPSNVWSVNRQFSDAAGFADYRQTFGAGQVVDDKQPFPARDTTNCTDVAVTYPTCVTDAQLTAELARLQSAYSLPAGTGDGAPVYLVVTPTDVNVCNTATDCASRTFCAYHSSFSTPSGTVLYAMVPMFFSGASAAQNPKFCQSDGNSTLQQPSGDVADVAVKGLGHEYSEVITDPTGSGWWSTASGNEDGDNCNFAGSLNPAAGTNPNAFGPVLGGLAAAGTLYDQVIAGDHWYTQTEWSNGDANCQGQPATALLSPSFTAPAWIQIGSTASFDPAASSSPQGYTSVTWSFGDGSAPAFARTTSTPAAASHRYLAPGVYKIAMTVVDTKGNLAIATDTVAVGTVPPATTPA
jgi:hypothetical protein